MQILSEKEIMKTKDSLQEILKMEIKQGNTLLVQLSVSQHLTQTNWNHKNKKIIINTDYNSEKNMNKIITHTVNNASEKSFLRSK